MQHHGIPTRLLDWTEILAIALYFALKNYDKALSRHWNNKKKFRDDSKSLQASPFFFSEIKEIPSIWILNPYKASREATGRLRIWDFTTEARYDYFEKFIVNRNWHFKKPVPMYSPWRNPRIASQQSMFTVFGFDQHPMDELFSKSVLQEVKISPLAAIYGVKHLKDMFGLDHFMIFRDLDSLATKVRKEFLER